MSDLWYIGIIILTQLCFKLVTVANKSQYNALLFLVVCFGIFLFCFVLFLFLFLFFGGVVTDIILYLESGACFIYIMIFPIEAVLKPWDTNFFRLFEKMRKIILKEKLPYYEIHAVCRCLLNVSEPPDFQQWYF